MNYQPKAGSVVICDFEGMKAPEMVKTRDVVVIASHADNSKLVTVIPLSTTAPRVPKSYHYQLNSDPRPEGDSMNPVWAKCDMIYTISIERLKLHYRRTRRSGRETVKVQLSPEDLLEIKRCVASALNL